MEEKRKVPELEIKPRRMRRVFCCTVAVGRTTGVAGGMVSCCRSPVFFCYLQEERPVSAGLRVARSFGLVMSRRAIP
jgi:hypothetical protein